MLNLTLHKIFPLLYLLQYQDTVFIFNVGPFNVYSSPPQPSINACVNVWSREAFFIFWTSCVWQHKNNISGLCLFCSLMPRKMCFSYCCQSTLSLLCDLLSLRPIFSAEVVTYISVQHLSTAQVWLLSVQHIRISIERRVCAKWRQFQ